MSTDNSKEQPMEWIEVLPDETNLPKNESIYCNVRHGNRSNTGICYYNQKHSIWMYKGSDWMWVDLPVTHYKIIQP